MQFLDWVIRLVQWPASRHEPMAAPAAVTAPPPVPVVQPSPPPVSVQMSVPVPVPEPEVWARPQDLPGAR
jgi:hypothetical protein